MSTDRNKEIAAEFLKALGKGWNDRITDMMTDDATYWIAGKPELLPIAGTKTKEDLLDVVAAVTGTFEGGLAITIKGTVAEEDRVAVEAVSHGKTASGTIYDNAYHFLLTFREGKISGVKEYMDTHHVAQVLNPLS